MNCSFEFLYQTVRNAGEYIAFHSHRNYELVYYESGAGTTTIGKRTWSYGPGEFAIIPPGCKHDESRRESTRVMFVCFFYDMNPVRLQEGVWKDTAERAVYAILKRMSEELSDKKPFYEVKLNALASELLVETGRVMGSPGPDRGGSKMEYAKNLMDQYFSEGIELTDIARQLGYSYDHFRHQFKVSTGYSPMQYMIRSRMEKAMHMLQQTDKAITAVSEECGFSNLPQFSLMFKQQHGMTPRAYRARHKPN
jgi:AraC-like DNA-binding protein